mmetsp:Transcript_25300/g.69573  ORF Transcript_25300/g.69573 Transcript_25300/m.69573 type:complete len:253 (+) Transcript_25300:366-1124(+)
MPFLCQLSSPCQLSVVLRPGACSSRAPPRRRPLSGWMPTASSRRGSSCRVRRRRRLPRPCRTTPHWPCPCLLICPCPWPCPAEGPWTSRCPPQRPQPPRHFPPPPPPVASQHPRAPRHPGAHQAPRLPAPRPPPPQACLPLPLPRPPRARRALRSPRLRRCRLLATGCGTSRHPGRCGPCRAKSRRNRLHEASCHRARQSGARRRSPRASQPGCAAPPPWVRSSQRSSSNAGSCLPGGRRCDGAGAAPLVLF